jgi:sugar transferase (PEP-CTERM/EpsH1 system associated)
VVEQSPLVAHVIHRLQVGGLENGLVNLINRLPPDRYRHVIVSLTDHSDFRRRLTRDVPVYDLHKRPGKDIGLYWRLWRLFRQLRPDIVHTRNLSALEAQIPAALAGVPVRVHGEHGRDVHDLDNTSRKYRWLRRGVSVLVHAYVPLSRELERYLVDEVGIPARKVTRIINGVDTERFHPSAEAPRVDQDSLIIGTVGRMEAVKDPLNLVRAFRLLLEQRPDLRPRLRLLMVGDGSLAPQLRAELTAAGLAELAWLPGARDDTPELYRAMDVYVLPSLAEGISNTILEAMASGLPVIATNVGGNAELVEEGATGTLVPRADPEALADAIARYAESPDLRRQHGEAARRRAVAEFSLDTMVQRYADVYDSVSRRRHEPQRHRDTGHQWDH